MRHGRPITVALRAEGLAVASLRIDVTDSASIASAAHAIEEQYARLDILINNADISGASVGAPSAVRVDLMKQVYDTNVFGGVAVTNAMLPLLRKAAAGRVVNMTSGLGSLTLSSDPEWEFGQLNIMVSSSYDQESENQFRAGSPRCTHIRHGRPDEKDRRAGVPHAGARCARGE